MRKLAPTSASHFLIAALFLSGLLILNGCKNEKKQPEPGNNQTRQGQSDDRTFTARNLRDAALQGRAGEVRQMVEQGVDINASDEGGRTALMLASFNGHTEIVRLLLEKGARIEERNTEGRTSLIFAASGPFPDTVEQLLAHGADADAIDRIDGWSALMFAAAEGNTKVVQVLLDHGADRSLTDKDGETALDFALNNSHTGVAELLKTSQNER